MFMNPFPGSCTCTHHFSPVGYWGPTNSTPLSQRNNEAEKLDSISEIQEYKDKSHEELHWEDKANGQSSRRPSLFPSAFKSERNNNNASAPNLCRCGQNSVFGTEPLSTTTGASSSQTFKNTMPPFGASSTPSSSSSIIGFWLFVPFGSPCILNFDTASTPAFGTTSFAHFGSTTSPTFGSTGAAFGFGISSGALVSSTSALGSSSSIFGTSSHPDFDASFDQPFIPSSTHASSIAGKPVSGCLLPLAQPASQLLVLPAHRLQAAGRWGGGATLPVFGGQQCGVEGGPAPAVGSGFGTTTSQPNPLNPAQTFSHASSPFNATMFTPKAPSFTNTGFTTMSTPFSSSSFAISSTSTSPFTPSQTSSLTLFSSSSSAYSFSAPAKSNSILHKPCHCVSFGGAFTTPFSQPFSNPPTGFGLGISTAAGATSSLMGFNQGAPICCSAPFPSQPLFELKQDTCVAQTGAATTEQTTISAGGSTTPFPQRGKRGVADLMGK